MAKPSKKAAKSEGEVAAEATRKKEILDKVAQSNLPTKTILKDLGISRSTYYSWLKRYEEHGDDGLLDSRSLAKAQEPEKDAVPAVEEVQVEPPEVMEPPEVVEEGPPEPVAEIVNEEVAAPPPEEVEVKSEEPVAVPAEAEPVKEEEVVVATTMVPPSGTEKKKGMGGYALLAAVLLILGLLLSISLSNQNTYQLKKSSNTLTLWKGKFAPRGYEMVESFQPVAVGDNDVSALTSRTFADKDAVDKAIFAFFMDQVNVQTAQGDDADISKINLVLDQAEGYLNGNGKKDRSLSAMKFQLAQKRVAMAESGLHKAYQQALPIYQEALRAGLADEAVLEAKLDTMQKALELVPVVTPEAAGQEAEITSTEEVQTTEAEGAVAPAG
ncbi:MAG: helix-turn-helix domain-containing protein, partial [Deltaproteobacteria bacterium]|nr:helix-turn-helix domain-containing protein [Deltaproteobacteria bacterium]